MLKSKFKKLLVIGLFLGILSSSIASFAATTVYPDQYFNNPNKDFYVKICYIDTTKSQYLTARTDNNVEFLPSTKTSKQAWKCSKLSEGKWYITNKNGLVLGINPFNNEIYDTPAKLFSIINNKKNNTRINANLLQWYFETVNTSYKSYNISSVAYISNYLFKDIRTSGISYISPFLTSDKKSAGIFKFIKCNGDGNFIK